MSELIRKLKEKKFITKVKFPTEISDELISKEIAQTGSVKIVAAVKEEIGPVRPPYAVMRETNPELMDVCVTNDWAANNDYMTYEEAASLTYDMIKSQWVGAGSNMWREWKIKNITHFEEFEYFTGITDIDLGEVIKDTNILNIIHFPPSLTKLGMGGISRYLHLHTIKFNSDAPDYYTNLFQTVDSEGTTYIGSLVEGPKTVLVPKNAKGYDSGPYLDPLQHPDKCNFTIQYF